MTRITPTIRLACAVVVACALLAGCGLSGSSKNGREPLADMDMQGAAEQADRMFYATVGAIKPEVEWTYRATTTGSCDVTRYWTVMTVVSEQRRGNFLGVVERFWKSSDYRIKTVNPSKNMPAIYARSPEGFGIRVKIGYKGQAFLQVTSPCVGESKVAVPTKMANGLMYDGKIPTPNVHSDFWSAETPVPGTTPAS
ncbi:hypothetical protein ACFWPP_30305 [Streptomyces anulatus]|uniref:hypothetical protein n=1 Tax=Streptomyces anulatus TaxID=1892 RepID=UPI00365B8D37